MKQLLFAPRSSTSRPSQKLPLHAPLVIMCVQTDMTKDARVEREATVLAHSGFRVKVICRQLTLDQPLVERRAGFEILRLPSWSARISNRWLLSWLRGLEFTVRSFVYARGLNGDVYHAHDLDRLLSMYLVAYSVQAPIIYDAHELFNERTETPKRGYWPWLERFLLPKVDGVIAANQERAEVMYNEYGAPSLPIVLENMPLWQDIAPNSLLRDFVRDSGREWEHIILYQGVIRKSRSVEVIFQAITDLDKTCGVVLLGPVAYRYKNQLLSLAEELGVAERVLFHPPLPYHSLLNYTASATIGVALYENSSRNNYLCAPNKVYEYMMTGIPMIASNFPPIQRLFSAHDLGELVEPDDPNSIAAGINRLLSDAERRVEIAATASRLSRESHNFESISDRLVELYRTIVHVE